MALQFTVSVETIIVKNAFPGWQRIITVCQRTTYCVVQCGSTHCIYRNITVCSKKIKCVGCKRIDAKLELDTEILNSKMVKPEPEMIFEFQLSIYQITKFQAKPI